MGRGDTLWAPHLLQLVQQQACVDVVVTPGRMLGSFKPLQQAGLVLHGHPTSDQGAAITKRNKDCSYGMTSLKSHIPSVCAPRVLHACTYVIIAGLEIPSLQGSVAHTHTMCYT